MRQEKDETERKTRMNERKIQKIIKRRKTIPKHKKATCKE